MNSEFSAFILPLSHLSILSLKTSLLFSLSLQTKWLRSLNHAVDQVLGGACQGSSPGVTAMSRTASYTFTGEGRFKDAQYTGTWQAGRVHGRLESAWVCVCVCACLSHLHLCSYNVYCIMFAYGCVYEMYFQVFAWFLAAHDKLLDIGVSLNAPWGRVLKMFPAHTYKYDNISIN